MPDAFDRAAAWILEAEGGDSDRPSDSGGRTRFGISQRAHPKVDVPHLTWEAARAIYRAEYWGPIHGDDLPEPLGLVLFDARVNMQPLPAVRTFQAGLIRATRKALKTDGIVGPRTIGAASYAAQTPELLKEAITRILAARAREYMEITLDKPPQIANLDGWLCRLFRLEAWVGHSFFRERDS